VSWTPKKSVLHKTISAIRAETWEAINRTVLAGARQEKIEPGKVIRLDCTVTAALPRFCIRLGACPSNRKSAAR